MSDKKFDFENEKDFDKLIESSFSELPPADIAKEVTPWRKATNRVVWGLALRMVTLQFLGLGYILPFIGTLLALLGFRRLRRENGYFNACYIICSVNAACFFSLLVFNTTLFHLSDYGALIEKIAAYISIVSMLLILFCLRAAFIAVRRKATLTEGAGAATALIVWYVILAVLALMNYEGLIIPILMLVSYAFIIRNLLRLSKTLDEAGYAVSATPIKVSDRAFVAAICSLVAAGIISGYAFFNSYLMNWAPVETVESSEITEIKENLLELGFPEDVLKDISEEDILACKGAVHVVFLIEEFSGEGYGGGTPVAFSGQLKLTGVGVKLPDEEENWKIFHHFQWVGTPRFYGTESLRLRPATQNGEWVFVDYGEETGRVLYDKDGITYSAPYYSLGIENYTSDDVFFGESNNSDLFATFSMPNDGENHRGYVSYGILQAEPDRPFVHSWLDYTHQVSPFQYPVKTAKDNQRYYGALDETYVFQTVNSVLRYSADTDGTDLSYDW